jgi:hypothetical protein
MVVSLPVAQAVPVKLLLVGDGPDRPVKLCRDIGPLPGHSLLGKLKAVEECSALPICS